MSKFIEDFYYGNIEPQESSSELNTELKRKLSILTQTEEQLTSKLTEEDKELFVKYVSQFNDFLCASNADSFIAGFILGAKFTYNTFVSDLKEVIIMNKSSFEQNGGSYRMVGEYKIPNITLPNEANKPLGMWGLKRKDYLMQHKRVQFNIMLMNGTLWAHLAEVDEQASAMFSRLVEQIKVNEGIT